jgi:two-component system alkaline phosphatase synthesis response regulator PhoP
MKHILVVDDDVTISHLVCLILESAGYDVTRAHNGEEALRKMRDRKPDLVMLDVMMPVLDGRETARRMHADPTLKAVPIVFVTATPSALEDGDYPHVAILRKPVQIDALLETVAGVTR